MSMRAAMPEHQMMQKKWPWMLVTACLLWPALAPAQVENYRPLPANAWQLLEATPGIRIGGKPGQKANIQVVCDAHCPSCARLLLTLEQQRPDLALRWVPIAYLKPDSAAAAAAILASPDPASSLTTNYREYDFTARRGGYSAPGSTQRRLDPAHERLKRHWTKWGGFTPMVTVRTRSGRVVQAQGSAGPLLWEAIDQAAPPANGLKPWQSPQ